MMFKDFLVCSCTACNVVSVERSSCKNAVISWWRDVQRERRDGEAESPFGKGRSIEGDEVAVSVIAQTAEEEVSIHLLSLNETFLPMGCFWFAAC